MEDTITREDRLMLGGLSERDEAGRHFTQAYSMEWLRRMERLGYIQITRPTHQATGMQYTPEYWHVEVAPQVSEWFDAFGQLIEDEE